MTRKHLFIELHIEPQDVASATVPPVDIGHLSEAAIDEMVGGVLALLLHIRCRWGRPPHRLLAGSSSVNKGIPLMMVRINSRTCDLRVHFGSVSR
jgi:hypothetical protein